MCKARDGGRKVESKGETEGRPATLKLFQGSAGRRERKSFPCPVRVTNVERTARHSVHMSGLYIFLG